MEFRFDVRPLFNHPIVKVNSNMLPIGFRGDRRLALDTATKVAEIVNEMGAASARAQGLSNPVTTAQKLRMADQNVYLLCDPNQGRNGSVIGLLKVGKKSLYVFDQNGQTQMVNAPCVLDFYVHESRQRAGLGKDLFDTMLQQEEFVPQKLAVDRPSNKLLGFLRKHYGLQKTIPQMNNFVVYDGFFEKPNQQTNVTNHDGRMHITASPNTALFGPQFINEEQAKRAKAQQAASNTSIPLIQSSPVGRYAAPRPMGSMAECLSNANDDPNANDSSSSSTVLNMKNENLSTPAVLNTAPANQSNVKTSPSHASLQKPSPSHSSLQKPSPSNMTVNRKSPSNPNIVRAAGLPSQNYYKHYNETHNQTYNQTYNQNHNQNHNPNYNQPAETQIQVNEVPVPVNMQVNSEINPAEPVEKAPLYNQETKNQTEQSEAVEAGDSNAEVFHEVCPKCAAKFPSTRGSAVKISQSKTSIPGQQNLVVNTEPENAIIHNTATTASGEPKSNSHEPSATEPYHDTVFNETVNVNTVNVNIENLQLSEHEDNAEDDGQNADDEKRSEENHQNDMSNGHHHQVHHQQQQHHDHHHPHHRVVKMDPIEHFIEEQILEPMHIQKPSGFPLSKQHTGMKNISYNVSMAVSPTDQVDFVHKSPESPVEARIIRPLENKAAGMPSHENNDDAAVSPGSGDPYTGQGYYDLKFYHNKLW